MKILGQSCSLTRSQFNFGTFCLKNYFLWFSKPNHLNFSNCKYFSDIHTSNCRCNLKPLWFWNGVCLTLHFSISIILMFFKINSLFKVSHHFEINTYGHFSLIHRPACDLPMFVGPWCIRVHPIHLRCDLWPQNRILHKTLVYRLVTLVAQCVHTWRWSLFFHSSSTYCASRDFVSVYF